ncbi:hypothetical protein C7459_101321 [Tumebacillus permanentifrigoris]|uniref:Uncharacterized protein n=2 Tax=Tumebacillus permanentifrigoris TaxID=378543 RepID=A0A316DE00_9BACL|nr:hypothetical protein C7459_101321 [Tumebacillus permanentifrigoris]
MWVGYDSEEQDGELFWNRGKVTKQVTKGVHPKYFSVEGDSYAWSNHLNRQWTIGISENGEQKTLVKSGEADALQFLTMSQRILAWTSYEKTQVYDRKLEKLITLDQKPATTVTTKGHYLYWAIPSGTPEQQQQIAKDSGIVAADMYLVDLDKI